MDEYCLIYGFIVSQPAIIPKDWREAMFDVRCSAQDPGEISGPDR